MKRFYPFLAILVLIFLSFGKGPTLPVQAADMSFSVQANLPNNQLNKKVTYFDLKMEPNQKQILTVAVQNTSSKKETIVVKVNNATTNQNGVIDYTKHKMKKDPSLEVGIEDIVQNPEQEIELGPKEKKDIKFELKMPAKSIKGIVLGGIQFMKKDENAKKEEKQVMIRNVYAFVTAIMLREKTEDIAPNLRLRSAQADLMNYRQVVTATLQNDQPTLLYNLKVKASVTRKGDKKVLKSTEKSNMNMAPSSSFNFPIPWGGEIQPGEYTMHIKAEAEKGKYKWTLNKDFVVEKDQADKVNDEAVQEEKEFPLWGYIAIGAGILFLLIILFLLLQLRKARRNREQ